MRIEALAMKPNLRSKDYNLAKEQLRELHEKMQNILTETEEEKERKLL